MRQRGWKGGIVTLAISEYHSIRVHENLVQYPSNDKSIVIINNISTGYVRRSFTILKGKYAILMNISSLGS